MDEEHACRDRGDGEELEKAEEAVRRLRRELEDEEALDVLEEAVRVLEESGSRLEEEEP